MEGTIRYLLASDLMEPVVCINLRLGPLTLSELFPYSAVKALQRLYYLYKNACQSSIPVVGQNVIKVQQVLPTVSAASPQPGCGPNQLQAVNIM